PVFPRSTVVGLRAEQTYRQKCGIGAALTRPTSYSRSCVRASPVGSLRPLIAQAALSVLASRQAMVIGPTPPGTGVIAPATSRAPAKATSPTMRDLPPPPAPRLMPPSVTVAPGLIPARRPSPGR